MQLVRVRRTPETEKLGLAGEIGEIYGFTTPSVTGVTVIGDDGQDFAESVFFEKTGEQLWFAEAALDYLDHDPSLEITMGGKRMFYDQGRWREIEPQ